MSKKEKDPKIQEKITEFKNLCNALGLKLTHQRLEIFSELCRSVDHPSAEILYKRLLKRISTLSLDTVYRTLMTFKEYGLIDKIETTENQSRFEVKMSTHHHFICKNCNKIYDFDWKDFDESALPDNLSNIGGVIHKSVIVYGYCNACDEKKNEKVNKLRF